MKRRFATITLFPGMLFFIWPTGLNAIDMNGNQMSDVWERVYAAGALAPSADADGDGTTNLEESLAGTDPFDAASFFKVHLSADAAGAIHLHCPVANPKEYRIYHRANLGSGSWQLKETIVTSAPFAFTEYPGEDGGFYRVELLESDSDGDGASDWEEVHFGFDPTTAHTDREGEDDLDRITDALSDPNVISLHVTDGDTYENWPDPADLVIRRSGGFDPITIYLDLSGTASPSDYSGLGPQVTLPPGRGQTILRITPLDDGPGEVTETLDITLLDGADYDIGDSGSATLRIHDAGAGVSPKEASRLLAQASFGATLPDIAAVEAAGIEGWIDDQMNLPHTLLQDSVEAVEAYEASDPDTNFYANSKLIAWWGNAIDAPDQLRQRVAFALSEILVVSDEVGMIGSEAAGMANYYDIFVRHAFGNYRDVLEEVTYHPVMGIYLSHKGNRAPDPSIGRFPDENYAREIMQLFTIGLWMLNPDGSRMLDGSGEPIPTYTNFEISELARVFTGMNWGTNDATTYWTYNRYPSESATDPYTVPMQFWEGREIDPGTGEWLPYREWNGSGYDEFFIRDKGSKELVTGVTVPAGQLGGEDVSLALDTLFNHPNVGPFIALRLIQRLTTSNPSPAYIERVATTFNDNGSGVRGDLGAVVKAVLMDPEARDFSMLDEPTFGKMREPYLRFVTFGRSLNLHSASGLYAVLWNDENFAQRPLGAPSVFNFFVPDYSPPGSLETLGLYAPEFQITNTVTSMTVPNELYWTTRNGHLSWYSEPHRPYVDYSAEIAMLDDPDALIEHLDLLLTYGHLDPVQKEIIRYAVDRRIAESQWGRPPRETVGLAVYLILNSPDFVIQK